jgi:Fe-S cluster assembly protein SufB
MSKKSNQQNIDLGDYQFGFSMPERSVHKTSLGLDAATVSEISGVKGEGKWMRDFRLKSYAIYQGKPMPNWGADLSDIDFDAITY